MCSHLFFPTIPAYSADILEAGQHVVGSIRLNISYNLNNLNNVFFFFFFCVVFTFWINKSGVQQFVLCARIQLSWSKREISWDCADKMVCEYVERLSVSLQHREILESSSALFSVFFCFPQEPLKLSVPGNNYMFPRGSPNIQGIRRHLAC